MTGFHDRSDKDATCCRALQLRRKYLLNEEAKAQMEQYYEKTVVHPSRFDWTKYKGERAGIVLFTFNGSEFRFILGVDREFDSYTDFGGRVLRKDISLLDTAFREFHEESCVYPCFDLERSVAVISPMTCLLFFFVSPGIISKVTSKSSREISMSTTFSFEELCRLAQGKEVRGRVLWDRVRHLLQSHVLQEVGMQLSRFNKQRHVWHVTTTRLCQLSSLHKRKKARVLVYSTRSEQRLSKTKAPCPSLLVYCRAMKLSQTWYGNLINPKKTVCANSSYQAMWKGNTLAHLLARLAKHCRLEELLSSYVYSVECDKCVLLLLPDVLFPEDMLRKMKQLSVLSLAKNFNTEYYLRIAAQLLT
jgi:hypothetical protein